MKSSSKIALLAAGVAAFLFARKNKSVAGMGRVFSPYQIKWLILIPTIGVATKHDEELLNKFGFSRISNVALARHCANASVANTICDEIIEDTDLRYRLDKSYTCYEITDKQFGMIDARNGWSVEAIMNVITEKQNSMRWIVYNGKE